MVEEEPQEGVVVIEEPQKEVVLAEPQKEMVVGASVRGGDGGGYEQAGTVARA
jgi:hypothetical protein